MECVHLQDVSARAHRVHVVHDHPQFHKIMAFPGPAKSPDLSLRTFVGHPWDTCPEMASQAKDINKLADALQEEWHQIPQATIGWHCLVCLAVNGGPTHCRDLCEIDILPLTELEVPRHVSD